MEPKHHILVLSVSAGAGHVRAAEALCRTASSCFFSEVKLTHLDVMESVPRLFKKLYAESYLSVIKKHPFFWGYLYEKTDKLVPSGFDKVRIMVEHLNTNKLRRYIQEHRFDQIICTHFLPAQILSKMISRKKLKIPVWVQVTDFDIHALWVHPNMSGYFVANEEVAHRLRAKGIPSENIYVTGIPVMPAFSKKFSRDAIAREWGLDSNKKIVLIMAGGAGINDIHLIVQSLLEIEDDFQIVALAGKNKPLFERLKKISACSSKKVIPVGFTEEMEKWMSVSDLAITKPGGLTTSECLAIGLPMLIISPIPGQEERNADFLLENGAALKAHDMAGIEYRIQKLMKNPGLLQKLQKQALRLSKPLAGEKILRTVLNISSLSALTQ